MRQYDEGAVIDREIMGGDDVSALAGRPLYHKHNISCVVLSVMTY